MKPQIMKFLARTIVIGLFAGSAADLSAQGEASARVQAGAGGPDETSGRSHVLTISRPVESLSWSPDGSLLAVQTSAVAAEADRTRTTEIWDVDRQELKATLSKTMEPTFSLSFSPDGGSIACVVWKDFGSQQPGMIPTSEVRIWDTTSGKQIKSLAPPPAQGLGIRFSSDLLCLAFSPDGRFIAAGGKLVGRFGVDEGKHIGGEVCVWNARTGELKWSERELHTDIVNAVAFSPDGETLANAGIDKLIRLCDSETGRLKSTLVGATWDGISSLAFSPDGKLLATGGRGREEGGAVRIWDVQSRRALHSFPRGFSEIASGFVSHSNPRVIFSPDGGTLFAAAVVNDASPRKFQVRMWGIPHGKSKGILAEHRGAPTGIVISSDGSRLAVGTYEGEIIFMDTNP